ncbi:MAG: LysR family transcriptional regulator [Hyphomicrobiales bacterium]|nr:LysR family transcriptional regulator [Hyphomicrobiales bacterium]
MKDSLRAGVSETRKITVDRDRTIDFMGDDCRVYATPSLVRDIEQTCRDLIVAHADDGEDSVGSFVTVYHTAPTLLGMSAEITVTVKEVEGRRVRFEITGKDDLDPICKGEHERFVVDVAKTAERLKGKAAKAASA